MIEQNIIEWLELGDSVQKLDLYNKRNISFYIMNYLLSQFSHFSEVFYLIVLILYFFQIWELNISKLDVSGDGILKVIKYIENIFLFNKIINGNDTLYIIFLVLTIFLFFISLFLSLLGMVLFKKRRKKNRFLSTTNSIINILNVYYINGPSILILFSKLTCSNGEKEYICPINSFMKIFSVIFILLYAIVLIIGHYIATLYINDIGSINGSNVRCKINNNYTPIIIMIKIGYFILNYFYEIYFYDKKAIMLLYIIVFMLSNIFISIYTYRELFYYNYYINTWFHYGWKYTTWFSICIFLKKLINIKDITLYVILGLIIITMAIYFNNKHKYFELITEFNMFEGNDLKNIQIFNHKLLGLLKNNDQKSKILISGVIKRFEEYVSNNMELYEQYNKLLNDPHLQKKFTSENELAILSIISIIYSYNIEKSKDIFDITLNMCYFLINRLKNPLYAIWLCTKLKSCNNTQSYYKYILIEEIRDYLIAKMKKNTQKITIRNVQISSSILYNQYADLFKIKIYEATCSQIEYFDILRNKIATTKTVDNYLRVGEDVLSLRKETFKLWDKIILLNPFSYESKNDYLLYIDSVLQDHILAKNEEKRFYALQTEKMPEKENIYYSMFNQEISSVLLADGYSFNGRIVYATPNFSYLFMFSEKEIINTSIDDLLPDVIQNFHKYLIEDTIKNSNLSYVFKDQRDSLLKGKNGIIFNVNLYVKPAPNLLYGLLYFIYVRKNLENNFILILDENLMINGFTEINQMGSNFIWGNNYDLTHTINGHHIGLIIPEILLYINYDVDNNTFSLPKNSIDLKGYLYPISNFKELDEKIPLILDELKTRKIMEINNENKQGLFDEYDDLIKILNMQQIKPFSIFFRCELHNFLGGKYKYYRIYITSDLLSKNDNILNSQSISKSSNNRKNKNTKEHLKQTIMSKIRIKELSEDMNSNFNKEKNNKENEKQDFHENKDNLEKKDLKVIKLKNNNFLEENKNNDNINENLKYNKLSTFSHKNPNFDLNSRQSMASNIHPNTEPVVFNKIKKHILIKNDCIHVKTMRYLIYIFIPVNIILIIFEFYYSKDLTDKIIEFLKDNNSLVHPKICAICIYSSALNLKLIKQGYIKNDICPNNNCTLFYINIIRKGIMELRKVKAEIYDYHESFQKSIFNKKIKVDLYFDNSTEYNTLELDIYNGLNLVISKALKLISILTYSDDSSEDFNICLKNMLSSSLKYVNSDYKRFSGEQKEKLTNKISIHIPFCLGIYLIFLFYVCYIFYDYIILIKNVHIFYFDKLMNFSSTSFESYLKKLDEIKKKFRDETNEEEEKNIDEFDLKDEMDEKNEYNSKLKNDEKSRKEEHLSSKSLKKKKQSKIQQQKLKNKKIILDYFYKINLILIMKFGILFLLSTSYYISTIIINLKVKNNYFVFDYNFGEINKSFYSYYQLYLKLEQQIEKFEREKNISELVFPVDNTIVRKKFGDNLIYIIKSTKYSEKNLELFEALYNENACEVIIEDETYREKCKTVLSSILSKGFEQAIVQLSSIITNILDDLNSLKETKTISDIYKEHSTYFGYDLFMEYYMYKSFLITKDIFEEFKNDEKFSYYKINKINLLIFCIFYFIIFSLLLIYLYQYKDFTGSFLSFIGIIPPQYIADDNEFYQQVIGLDPFYS